MAYDIVGAINDITGKGAGNITEAVSDLNIFMTDLTQKIAEIKAIDFHVCSSSEIDGETGLPDVEEPNTKTVYLVAVAEAGNNLFDEYIWLEDSEAYEKVGSVNGNLPQRVMDDPTVNGGVLECAATAASGQNSHAEGYHTSATGTDSHAEGSSTTASGASSHAGGTGSVASGSAATAIGSGAKAAGRSQTVIGEYNVEQGSPNSRATTDYAFIIGNGTDNTPANRSNAFGIKWDGTFVFANGTEISPAQFASLKALLN